MAELRAVKLTMKPGQVETAEALAQLRGLDRSAYIRRLIQEDAERCAAELRRLSWATAREDVSDTPPQPVGGPGEAAEGV